MTEEILEEPQEELEPLEESNSNHYVDRKEFYAAMVEYRRQTQEAKERGEEKPPVSSYLAKCFLDIASHLTYRRNFYNYSYKDEMIMDGVEVCLRYAHNFNPEKSNHPFSYFNKLCWQAFVHRIKKEKAQQAIKGQLILQYSVDSLFEESEEMDADINNHVIEYIKENSFIAATEPPKKKRTQTYTKSGIELFMTEEENGE
jgi:hypothetical protein